jgi:hypothetical protein
MSLIDVAAVCAPLLFRRYASRSLLRRKSRTEEGRALRKSGDSPTVIPT